MTDTQLPKNDEELRADIFQNLSQSHTLSDPKSDTNVEITVWSDDLIAFIHARDTKMLEHVIGGDVSIDEAKSLAKVRRDGTNGTKFAHDPDAVVKADAINDDHKQQRERAKQWLEGDK